MTFITSVSNGEMIEGTITGPCPSGIVVVPVNNPLEFGCSFRGDLIFYWVIDATNGSWSYQVMFIKKRWTIG